MAATSTRPAVGARVLVATTAVVAGVTCAVTLLAAGGRPPTGLPAGLGDPGPVLGWGLRLTRLAGLLAGVLTVGSLLVTAGLAPPDDELHRRCLRWARRTAAVWALVGAIGYVLSTCDALGVPLTAVGPAQLLPWETNPASAAHFALALGAGFVALAAGRATSTSTVRALLVVALATALPVPATGHVAAADDGGAALSGLLVHVVAALLWVGGLAGLILHLRGRGAALAVAAPRFSVLALGAYLTLAGSGLIAVSGMLPLSGPGWVAMWSSGYAGVVAAKVAVLVALGAFGLRHRRRTLPRLVAGEPRAFVSLAAGELLLMAAAAGLATALAQTPVPAPALGTAGHSTASAVEELSLAALVTAWRPNAVVLLTVGAALAAYVRATRSSCGGAREGWPRRRTLSFAAGCAVAVVTLCSGVATYSSVLVSVHVAQLLVMLLVVPPLLLLGRPEQLSRPHGLVLPGGFARTLDHPATGAVATFALLTVVYRTPVVTLTLRSSWWHLLVLVLALGCGLLLFRLLRVRREAAGWLLTVSASLAMLAWQLGTGDQVVAAAWFAELRLGWADPLADQRLAAVAAAVAAGLVGVVAVVAAQRGVGSRAPAPNSGQMVVSTRPSRSSASTGP